MKPVPDGDLREQRSCHRPRICVFTFLCFGTSPHRNPQQRIAYSGVATVAVLQQGDYTHPKHNSSSDVANSPFSGKIH